MLVTIGTVAIRSAWLEDDKLPFKDESEGNDALVEVAEEEAKTIVSVTVVTVCIECAVCSFSFGTLTKIGPVLFAFFL